jgi:ABC-type phosphate/phosphonate transport system substrate-binding protein
MADIVKIGVFSPGGFESGMHRWQPTATYLENRLPHHRFQMLPYRNLQELEQDALRGKFDFILTQPASFVKLEQQVGLLRLLTLQQQDASIRHANTATVIFTRADHTELKSLSDFNQTRFVTTRPQDFSGWQLARLELLRHHQDPEKAFSKLEFAGDAEAVLRGVMEGNYDAGAMSARQFDRFLRLRRITPQAVHILEQQQRPDFPFRYSGSLYPDWPLGGMPATSASLQQQVVQALLEIPQHHPALQAGDYAGWTTARDYRTVRPLLDKSLAQQLTDRQLEEASLWLEQHRPWFLISLVISLFAWLLVRLITRPKAPQKA